MITNGRWEVLCNVRLFEEALEWYHICTTTPVARGLKTNTGS